VGEGVAAEIDRRLAAVRVANSRNSMSASELRGWTVDHLSEYDQELVRFPESAGKSHWNLWMIDTEFEDALFAVLVFHPSEVEFFCGTGNAFAIKRFAETNFPDEVEQLLAEMARAFSVPEGSLHLVREEAEAWLGRGW
jgi:hypothetical protein